MSRVKSKSKPKIDERTVVNPDNPLGGDPRDRILVATPTLGLVRVEWATARYNAIIPCNWTASSMNVNLPAVFPIGYMVAEGQNVAVAEALERNFQWLFLIEDDVILPPDAWIKLNEHMRAGDAPIISGLYFTKSEPAEPILYRGRGNSFFADWKPGDRVWCDGVPTGCLMIHTSILKVMWNESPPYMSVAGRQVRRLFETPRQVFKNPEGAWAASHIGTSDLYWCDRVIRDNVLARAGWKKVARRKYPFLVDTSIHCGHIDRNTGIIFGKGEATK